MTKYSGLGDRLFVNGMDMSGDVGSVQTIGHTIAEQDVTGLNKSAKERLQLLHDGQITFASYFSDTATGPQEALRDLSTLAQVTYLNTNSGYGAGLIAKQFQSQWTRGADGALLGSIDAKASGGTALEWGSIFDADAFSDDDSGEVGTAFDLGASHGIATMAFYLHLSSAATLTDATILIEEDDNSSFTSGSTYGTFTQLTTAPGYQRLAVASAPERYLRWSVDGTYGSVTFTILAVATSYT